jgi:hypothetical protein
MKTKTKAKPLGKDAMKKTKGGAVGIAIKMTHNHKDEIDVLSSSVVPSTIKQG